MSLETLDISLNVPVPEEDQARRNHHRTAAAHFAAAAWHQLIAGTPGGEGKLDTANRHAYLAYRHQLYGAQYAESVAIHLEKRRTDLERVV